MHTHYTTGGGQPQPQQRVGVPPLNLQGVFPGPRTWEHWGQGFSAGMGGGGAREDRIEGGEESNSFDSPQKAAHLSAAEVRHDGVSGAGLPQGHGSWLPVQQEVCGLTSQGTGEAGQWQLLVKQAAATTRCGSYNQDQTASPHPSIRHPTIRHPSFPATAPTTGAGRAFHWQEPWRNHPCSVLSSSPHGCRTLGVTGARTGISTSTGCQCS